MTGTEIISGGFSDNSLHRMNLIVKAYLKLIWYFENLGDTAADAEIKIITLSRDINSRNGFSKFDYILGDVQPLKDEIQASELIFMDQNAKDYIISYL